MKENYIKKEWSKEQNNLTMDVLDRIDIVAFSFQMGGVNKGCMMNHLDGKTGYITLNDAISYNWRIFDYHTDELLESFDSIEEIIAGGWKVST